MKTTKQSTPVFLLAILMCLFSVNIQAQIKIQEKEYCKQLNVDGKPFLIIGGHVHNSASGNAEYFDRVVSKLKQMCVNTVIAPVSWELFEPSEGNYDYSQVDYVISTARKHNLKLIIIWFGSWKNGTSQYAPVWVKQNNSRFPRALNEKGEITSTLSTFGEATKEADKKAFGLLMKHIKEIDSEEKTVLMAQINNEVGLFVSRDYGPVATQTFNGKVPRQLTNYLKENEEYLGKHLKEMWTKNGKKMSGTWQEIFGDSKSCHEIFMAWHYAKYMGEMAVEGKKQYEIPLYVNAWLAKEDKEPGQYPSGGPVHKVIDIWKAAAPEIDFYSPDLYGKAFKKVCNQYHREDNLLFIPETNGDVWFTPEPQNVHQSARNIFWALAEHDAIGFCPFGLEGLGVDSPITESYKLLNPLSPTILEYQGTGKMRGILQNDEKEISAQQENGVMEIRQAKTNTKIEFENYVANINYNNSDSNDRSYGLIINTSKNEFLIVGYGLVATFTNKKTNKKAGFAEIWEQVYKDGEFVNGRRLNGDETNQGSAAQIPFCSFDNFDNSKAPRVLKVKLYNIN